MEIVNLKAYNISTNNSLQKNSLQSLCCALETQHYKSTTLQFFKRLSNNFRTTEI